MATATLPVAWCGRGAGEWMEGDLATQLTLSRGITRLALGDTLSRSRFRTGSDQFSGEWLFGTYLMAGIGFAQLAIEHPEFRDQQGELTRQCIDRLLSPEVRKFDRQSWGEDPIDGIDGNNHHAAYLGYLNFLLGLHRLACGDVEYAELNDRITAALIRQMESSPIVLLETYPGEVYPVDNCFVIGSVGLHQLVTIQDHSEVIERWTERTQARYVDPETQLLIQAVSPHDGTAFDAPRGSGTALGAFALHYASPELARSLYDGIKRTLARTWLGFGAVREYPKGFAGSGDIDSGPIVFGYGMSATGFTIAGARRYNDAGYFRRLFATAHLCGAPVDRAERREYVSGGPLGNAILFAMLTVPRESDIDTGERR
ncbi:hypothetical protein ACFLSJ_08110 [Verrucomicrobiota bacterium]